MNEKNPTQIFCEEISNQLQYLRKYHQQVIKPLGHYTFPSITIINFLDKQILPKLKERNKNNIYVISDIMNWQMPQFIILINKIDRFIEHQQIRQSKTNVSKIKQGFNSQEEMLRVPQHFLKQKIINIAKEGIRWNNKKQSERNVKQLKSLQNFVQIYSKFVKDYEYQISKQQELIRRQVILKSFPSVKKTKIAQIFSKKLVFIAKLKMRAKKAQKRLNKRRLKILQLIDGQKNYLKKIQVYTQHVKKPIQKLNILSTQDKLIIFSTIQAILQFHKQFHAQLQKKYNQYHKYQLYGDTIRKYLSFFQIYQQYILYAPEATKKFKQLEQQNQDVQEICRKCMQQHKIKAGMALQQPTFKIARYQALFQNIVKQTNPIHPDYDKLVKVGQQFTKNLKKINNKVDQIVRRNRLNQLEQQFGTQQNPIFAQKRQFMEQFTLFFIKQEKLQPVIVFVFSDFLLVIDQNTRKKLKRIQIDQTFYARRQQDNKTYRNIIKVHSDGFTTFSAGNQQKNLKKAQQFYILLQKITKNNEQTAKVIYVQCIGTEQIGSTSFAKHTQYIVQIKFLGLRKYLYIRFSQMSPLVKKMQNYYKADFGITSEEDLKKNWFNNHKSKIIQDRKRTIQQILGKIFNSEQIKKKPQYFLQQLGIQSSFLHVLQFPQNRRQTFFNSSLVSSFHSSSIQSKMRKSKKQHKQPQTVLCATQIKLGRQLYHDHDQVILQKKKSASDKVQIYINTVVNEEPIKVIITEYNTVEDVCIKVSKLIGLRMNKDFRLFHEIGKKQLRVLEHQQKMMKLFSFPKNQVKIKGIFGQIADSFKKIFAPDTHPTLVFKKYYFLPIQIQTSETKKDLTRLRLLVYQIFTQIRQMKYQLSFDQYLLFLAMIIYIQNDGKIPKKIDDHYVLRVIPETIFKLKNYSEQQWIMKAHPHLSRLNDEIEKIIQFNREQLKHKKIKADSVSKTALYFGHRHLCSQIVINKIKSNPIYGSNLFYVQPYKATYDKLLQNGCKMAYNMWLAIKVQSLNLLTPSSKQTVLQLKYSNIQKVFVYSQAIIFKMDGLVTEQYRLNTYQSFQISQLVKYNKALNETLKELERDQDLIEKARLYKQELLIYRNTYDQKKQ